MNQANLSLFISREEFILLDQGAKPRQRWRGLHVFSFPGDKRTDELTWTKAVTFGTLR